MVNSNTKFSQNGFTLVEIIVSTAIFVTVVASMLAIFNYTLQINRRVQALREVVQGTRTFAETVTREIRNGRIDYSSWTSECDASNYTNGSNKTLSILTKSGDKLCFYFEGGQMYLKKQTPSGSITAPVLSSERFGINESTFAFIVQPSTDPNPDTAPYPLIQPLVTIVAEFTLNDGVNTPTTINYQTTISTDVYDTQK